MQDSHMIAVVNLRKTYSSGLFRRQRVEALRGVSFEVGRGEIFGLLGPNGAGKTTLIKILLGIVRRTGGGANILGRSTGDRRGRRQVGYLPENHRIPRHLTGYSALEYYGQLSYMSIGEVRAKRDSMLEMVGLANWGKTAIKKYSKGMLQRLGLAQAMLHDPDLLILDEPTDGVDPIGRADIRNALFQLRDQGKTVFLNSHLLQELELVCNRVAILNKGQLKHVGPVDRLTEASSNDFEFELRGSEDLVKDVVAEFQPSSFESTSDGAITVQLKLDGQDRIDKAVDVIRFAGISIQSIVKTKLTLEQAFLRLVEKSDEES